MKLKQSFLKYVLFSFLFLVLSISLLLFFPYETKALTTINNCTDLQNMSLNLTEDYVLGGNIDCSGIPNFTRVGTYSVPFTGTLDGDGYTISDLTTLVDNSSEGTGLFGAIGNTGVVHDFNLTNVSITGTSVGSVGTGPVAGFLLSDASVYNVTVSGTVSGVQHTGGIVGDMRGTSTLTDSTSSVNVSSSNTRAGGAVGWTEDTPTMTGVHVSGTVSGEAGVTNVGGFGGYFSSINTVSDCSASGVVTTPGQNAGGFLGYKGPTGSITGSYATGDVSGGADTGGFIGQMEGGSVSGVYASDGDVSGGAETGGLIGFFNSGSVSDSYSEATSVSGTGSFIGGLIGKATAGSITNSYSSGTVSGSGNQIGGLIGFVSGALTISNSYSNADVTTVGALVGTGGLVGRMDAGSITNSYAVGAISGFEYVGGLMGANNGASITNSYSAGSVAGSGITGIGGFVGLEGAGSSTDSFWDITTSGQATSGGAETGKIIADMKTLATFTDTATVGLTTPWDFVGNPNDDVANNDYWNINGAINSGYPYLAWSVFPGITVSPISGDTTEAGGSATFTVVLDSLPTDTVTIDVATDDGTEGVADTALLTFTVGNWDTPQTVTVTGQDDDLDDGDIAYNIVLDNVQSTDLDYVAINPDDVAVTNTDNDTIGITVSPISGDTDETGGTATFTVVLDTLPSDTVTIDVATDDGTEGVADTALLTFTVGNWDTPQTVTVIGQDDDLDDGDIAYNIVLDNVQSTDLDYDGIAVGDVAVTNTDDDNGGVTVSLISTDTTEAGGSATFTVVLDSMPTGDVEIDSATDDGSEGDVVGGATLTFTAGDWDTPQTVTVTGQDDAVDDGDVAYNIIVSVNAGNTVDPAYDAYDPDDVVVTNIDNDTAGFTVLPAAPDISISEGDTNASAWSVVLTAEPASDVVIDISSGDVAVTVDTPSLTFTNGDWSVSQDVSITAPEDANALSESDVLITYTVNDGSSDDQWDPLADIGRQADVTDNDTPGISVSAISGDTTEAGGTATFDVVLNTLPTDTVTIDVATDDATEGTASDAVLTFTVGNWDTPQTVTVTGQDDAIFDGDIAYTIILDNVQSTDLDYDAFDAGDVNANNLDDEVEPTVEVAVTSDTEAEDIGVVTLTVNMSHASAEDVDVEFSVTGTATDGAGADYTVTASPVTISAGDTTVDISITVNDDVLDEDGETVIVTLVDPLNAVLGADDEYTLTITDDDAEPSVSFTSASQTVAETAGATTITAELSAVSGKGVTVPFTVAGTATGGGADYTITASPITITAGSSSANITVTIVNDSSSEGDETVIVTMGVPTNATAGATTAHTKTISANDSGGGGGGGGSAGNTLPSSTTPSDCLPGYLFSPLTGQACPASSSGPSDCSFGYLFSPSTGQACPASSVSQAPLIPFSPASPFCLINARLAFGSRGEEVKCLQTRLNTKIASVLATDGIFGRLTSAAVVKFQLANKLAGDAIVGPLTRAFLNK